MKEAVIVAGVRTAVGKAPRGTLRSTRPDDMAAVVIKDLLGRLPELPAETIDDVIMGCATPEASVWCERRAYRRVARRLTARCACRHR